MTPNWRKKVGAIRFFSATYRLFKLPELEPGREDYGQSVTYRGTAPHHPDALAVRQRADLRDRRSYVCLRQYMADAGR